MIHEVKAAGLVALHVILSLIFRYYNGKRPYCVVSDLDMLREIMVKQFDVFTDREVGLQYLIKIKCVIIL